MKMVNILTTANMLASMIMSEGGSLNALTPMSTPRLKIDMMSMMGP